LDLDLDLVLVLDLDLDLDLDGRNLTGPDIARERARPAT
jgi:hypothetical protein